MSKHRGMRSLGEGAKGPVFVSGVRRDEVLGESPVRSRVLEVRSELRRMKHRHRGTSKLQRLVACGLSPLLWFGLSSTGLASEGRPAGFLPTDNEAFPNLGGETERSSLIRSLFGARWSWEWKNGGVLVGMEVPPVLVRQAGSGLVNVGRVTVGP